MDFIAGAIKETGVDKDAAVFHGLDTGQKIGRGAALFVHHAKFDGVARKAEDILDPTIKRVGKGNLFGAVHLGLDHIDRACARISRSGTGQIMHCGGHGDGGIQHDLGGFLPIQKHRISGHQIPHVTHQKKRAARMGHRIARRVKVVNIGVQAAGDHLATLLDLFAQIAAHQAKPVGIYQALILGIHGGNRIFAILDRGHRAFQTEIRNADRIVLSNRRCVVDDDLDQEIMHPQKDVAVLFVARELARIGKTGGRAASGDEKRAACNLKRRNIGPRSSHQRGNLIKMRARPSDNLCPARGIKAFALWFALNCVGAIKRIIKASPAGIGGIQSKARVHHRHNKLWPGDGGDLGIDILRAHGKRFGLGHEVADFAQECAIGLAVKQLTAPRDVPGVDLCL